MKRIKYALLLVSTFYINCVCSQNENFIKYFDILQQSINDTLKCTKTSFMSNSIVRFDSELYTLFTEPARDETSQTLNVVYTYVAKSKKLIIQKLAYSEFCPASYMYYEMYFILEHRKLYRLIVDCELNISLINQTQKLSNKDKRNLLRDTNKLKKTRHPFN